MGSWRRRYRKSLGRIRWIQANGVLVKSIALLFLVVFLFSKAEADSRSSVSVEGRAFVTEQPRPVDQYEGLARAEYENRFEFKEIYSLKVHPFFQATTLPQAWGESVIADPRELYLAVEKNNYFAHAGYFTLVYEGTDGINPMDIASMKYWGDPLHSTTKASAGIHVGFTGNKIEFEAAYIPEQSQSSLPGKTSAWYPRKTRFPLRSEKNRVITS